jgi:hypothetical protein
MQPHFLSMRQSSASQDAPHARLAGSEADGGQVLGKQGCRPLRDRNADVLRRSARFGLDWLEDHPQWTSHFTPKHASWLNQIECYFSVLQRRVLTRGSFVSTDDLARAIERYMVWHNDHAKPFRWSYWPPPWSTAPAQLRPD